MKLLVSVTSREEALEAIKGGAHVIDVKNPREGSLGANFPRVIRQVRDVVPKGVEVSATIGDLPNLPGTASLAALGAAVSGADYVKAGLFGVKTPADAATLLSEVCRAVKERDAAVRVIAAGYADFEMVGCLNPLKLPEIAFEAEADGVMIDVNVKTHGKLFDLLSRGELMEFVNNSHDCGLLTALAGSLDMGDIPTMIELGADIMGVRRAVCRERDRLKGGVHSGAVREFVDAINCYQWAKR